jgi:hypothetical protein
LRTRRNCEIASVRFSASRWTTFMSELLDISH